ncbi:unnamed protein product [Durusdinium trenchii]|uniref:Transmembrane protein n=1 Tax=Durusdinium trenchii TaxID=1381693 RepID=A0ABP0MSI1_9DINO
MAQRRSRAATLFVVIIPALLHLTTSFVPPRALPPAFGIAQVLSAAPVHAEINREAYYAAAGINPDEIRDQMIDQMDPVDAALLGASDFWWGYAVPFSAGLGLVYGIGILTGQVEGPFEKQEDGEEEAKK